jgi:guanylate kinase
MVIDEPVARSEVFEPVRGRVFILSGPSGVGKDSVTSELRRERFPVGFCTTMTTRRPRAGEVDGVSYYFVDNATFYRLRDQDGLLEWALVHDNDYGIPRQEVRRVLQCGNDAMLTVDVQGGETLRRKLPGAVFIFLAPPSMGDLRQRLEQRGTESPDELEKRLRKALLEMEHLPRYDYVVLNHRHRLREAVEQIEAIITAERLRVNPRLVSL